MKNKKNCRRPLYNNKLAEQFVINILGITDDSEIKKSVQKIVNAEIALARLEEHPTHTHTDYRDLSYSTNLDRNKLHNQILKELITLERLRDDDEICLGKGGAKPSKEQNNSRAFIVMGAPASGKSGISSRLANHYGAYIIDSDYAKRKFPEYSQYEGGASLVHTESDDIIFDSENGLFVYCIYNSNNVVIPLVGKTFSSVDKICQTLIAAEYSISLIDVVLDRFICAQRAYKRFCDKKRYVPLSYVFDEVGNEPERVYYLLKRKYDSEEKIDCFAQISTNVPMGKPYKVLENTGKLPLDGLE